ncbi:hypothetical protein J8138_11390 [Lactiplantibacillus plantarum]|uniref:hypothetical protein n=1 Tax=Lactiplantibacillus plantarum TaxID=1590 RepID=UPI001B341DD0|nr:hypothetical protein [Lactiplantibacillus plantarum]MBP5840034.1 hypothetical protein [Lactiplantibacillus plantarum]
MSQEEDAKAIVALIKLKRNNWQISHRAKNYSAAVTLGMDLDGILDSIYQQITWRDYVNGPMADNHHPRIPGDVWLFGIDIENIECYLKFQIKGANIIFWISTHPAEYPLEYPFK